MAGLPTPRAAGAFLAPPDLDHSLYDPNTGFGCFGTFGGGGLLAAFRLAAIRRRKAACMRMTLKTYALASETYVSRGLLPRAPPSSGHGQLALTITSGASRGAGSPRAMSLRLALAGSFTLEPCEVCVVRK